MNFAILRVMEMVKEVGFYHLTQLPLEKALPRLLEKVYQAGHKIVVLVESSEQLEVFDNTLWTFSPLSFLPHGTAKDANPTDQPIWLTTHPENPNNATVLVVTGGVDVPPLEGFTRCLVLFNGEDAAALGHAREQWRALRGTGATLTYWQQDPQGGWSKKGE